VVVDPSSGGPAGAPVTDGLPALRRPLRHGRRVYTLGRLLRECPSFTVAKTDMILGWSQQVPDSGICATPCLAPLDSSGGPAGPDIGDLSASASAALAPPVRSLFRDDTRSITVGVDFAGIGSWAVVLETHLRLGGRICLFCFIVLFFSFHRRSIT